MSTRRAPAGTRLAIFATARPRLGAPTPHPGLLLAQPLAALTVVVVRWGDVQAGRQVLRQRINVHQGQRGGRGGAQQARPAPALRRRGAAQAGRHPVPQQLVARGDDLAALLLLCASHTVGGAGEQDDAARLRLHLGQEVFPAPAGGGGVGKQPCRGRRQASRCKLCSSRAVHAGNTQSRGSCQATRAEPWPSLLNPSPGRQPYQGSTCFCSHTQRLSTTRVRRRQSPGCSK